MDVAVDGIDMFLNHALDHVLNDIVASEEVVGVEYAYNIACSLLYSLVHSVINA